MKHNLLIISILAVFLLSCEKEEIIVQPGPTFCNCTETQVLKSSAGLVIDTYVNNFIAECPGPSGVTVRERPGGATITTTILCTNPD